MRALLLPALLQALLQVFAGTVAGVCGHRCRRVWALLRACMGTVAGVSGHCCGHVWALLRACLGIAVDVSGHCCGRVWGVRIGITNGSVRYNTTIAGLGIATGAPVVSKQSIQSNPNLRGAWIQSVRRQSNKITASIINPTLYLASY